MSLKSTIKTMLRSGKQPLQIAHELQCSCYVVAGIANELRSQK